MGSRCRKLVLATLLSLALVGCGSSSSLSKAVSDGKAASRLQKFEGAISAQPASRTITLEAGDALRWWVRPVSGSGGEFYLALTDPSGPGPADGGDSDGEPWSEFFSDFSDVSDSSFGQPIVQTTYEESPDATAQFDADGDIFSDWGRGWGSASDSGDWLVFVAPKAGTYNLLIGGRGSFEGQYEIRSVPTPPKENQQNFDSDSPAGIWTAASWRQTVKSQLSFMYEKGFYPSTGFFSDYSDASLSDFSDESASAGPGNHVLVYFGPEQHLAFVEKRIGSG